MRRGGRMRGSGGEERWPGGGVVVHPKALGNGVAFPQLALARTPLPFAMLRDGSRVHEAGGF